MQQEIEREILDGKVLENNDQVEQSVIREAKEDAIKEQLQLDNEDIVGDKKEKEAEDTKV